MPVQLKNNARSLLAVSISELDTIIRVRVGHGERFPALGDKDWFPLVLEDGEGGIEIMRAVARSGDAITVRRAQDGTTARAFGGGAKVSLRLTYIGLRTYITGEDPDDGGGGDDEGDPDYGGTGLIFNGLIVNAYHNETGRQGYFHASSGTSEGQSVFAGSCYLAAQAIQQYIDDSIPSPEPLALVGVLARAHPGEQYESQLKIKNALGLCTVAQISGDTLPPGHRITVNQYTKQVVIDWPAYAVLPGDPLFNGDFEKGDEGWIKGQGWSIEPTGNGNDGKGAYVGVYRGNGESFMEQEAFTECAPGAAIPVRVNVQQGASAENNCGAGIGMRFYDADKNLIEMQAGNQVWSGAKGRWHFSTLNSVAPEGAAFNRAVIIGGRKRENHPLWVDDAWWSMPETIGVKDPTTYRITLRITDGENNTADWTGQIRVAWVDRVFAVNLDDTQGRISYIDDGDEWTDVQVTNGTSRLTNVSTGGGLVFASDQARRVWVSKDNGETFEQAVLESAIDPAARVISVIHDATAYAWLIVLSNGSSAFRSEDGINFKPIVVDTFTKASAVGAPGKGLIGGSNNTVKISTDGLKTFSAQSSNLPLSGGSYGGVDWLGYDEVSGAFLALRGGNQHVARSPSGGVSSWVNTFIPRPGDFGTVLGAIHKNVMMLVFATKYRISTDGGLTAGPEQDLGSGLSTSGSPNGMLQAVNNDRDFFAPCSAGVMRWKEGEGWKLSKPTTSSSGLPSLAVMKI